MVNFDKAIPGSQLHPDDQKHVLSAYIYRYTKEHAPNWPGCNMSIIYVQFESDQDWLENTLFQVRTDGRLDGRVHSCHSSPTWPDNPELRRA